MTVRILHGDALEQLRTLADASVQSVVTDPPYELGFMGKAWDGTGIANSVELWTECLRVLKPGGHLLSFGGSRTYHRMACAIEDAGFEIRDQIMWIYASGFPKSLDVSKAIDRTAPRAGMFDAFAKHFAERRAVSGKTQKELAALFPSKTGGLTGCIWNWENGANVPTREQWRILQPLLDLSLEWLPLIERIEAEREVIGKHTTDMGGLGGQRLGLVGGDVTAPATESARQWQGWGTALKPAHEPIVVARKPLIGTVAANVLKHGTGAINVDGCRVGLSDDDDSRLGGRGAWTTTQPQSGHTVSLPRGTVASSPLGRWPANIIHDGSDEVLAGFPNVDGATSRTDTVSRGMFHGGDAGTVYPDSGSAARFFKECRWDNESSDQRASGAASRSGSCGTPTAASNVKDSRSDGKSEESQLTLDSTSDSKSCTPNLSLAPAEQWDSTAITPTTATPCALNGLAPPVIDASISSANEGRAAVGIDRGSATRFWYSAKASGDDRNTGSHSADERNHHPTVKPTDLMQYLVRLVTPPGGTVLDPFAGSGSTGIAADREGFDAILIERDAEYVEIARRRIVGDCPLFAELAA